MTLDQFAFDFYLKLRQRGLPLTIGEYKVLLEALQAGLGIKSKEDFLETCQLLWCKSLQHKSLISEEFQSYHQYVFAEVIQVDKNKNLEDKEKSKSTSSMTKESEGKGGDSDEDMKTSKGEEDSGDKTNASDQRGKEREGQIQRRFASHNAPIIAFYPSLEKEYSHGIGLKQKPYASDVDYIHSPFILTEEYLPLSLRQMQQSWRRLRHFASAIENPQSIDWQQTIHNTAQQGFFSSPVYTRVRENQFQLAILIDHHGSMVPHWTIGQQLIEAAKKAGGYPDAKVYYTHNIPSKYLYKTPHHTDSISVEDMLQESNPRHTVFMFFSDAGASRGLFNAQRVIATKRFVVSLGKRVHSMVWLNPMPKDRWENTSAELIKRLVPMFECTEGAIDAAINTLKRGRDARV